MSTSRAGRFVVWVAVVALAACSGGAPPMAPAIVVPDASSGAQAHTIRVVLSEPASEHTETLARAAAPAIAPRVVFKIQPAPNADGVITGRSPFDVTFNLCASEDVDGDRMLFTIDADGDGRPEELGTHGGNCRRTFSYTATDGEFRRVKPEVCVVDLDAQGAAQRGPDCRTYDLLVIGPPAATASAVTSLCPSPSIGNTTWTATMSGAVETCTCSLDNVVLIFGWNPPATPAAGTFLQICLSNGGLSGSWNPQGFCQCHS